MNFDTLIGNFVRHYNRQKMSFPPESSGTLLPAPESERRYLLYLHIPYCVVLCPFCSFHRVRFERRSATQYFDSLRSEISLVTDCGYRFDELYVGGGTPTVAPDELASTIGFVRELHSIAGISVETNPDDLDKDSVLRLRDIGVKRLSVGVQSFDDDLLREMRRLERYGCGALIRDRLIRRKKIFDTINVDMIFNFPHQSETSLRRDLKILTDEVGVDQVSFYPLMTSDSTARKMLHTMGRVDFSREKYFYGVIADHMLARGYSRASAWCFSRNPGMFDEYIVEREQYLGLGSGAFSYLQGTLFASTFSINHYVSLVAAGHTGTFGQRKMSERDQMRYYLMMQLFSGSLDKATAEKRFSNKFQRSLWPELTALQTLGAVRSTTGHFELTDNGYYLWVMLMREFFTGVNNLREQMRHRIPVASAHNAVI